MEKTKKIKILQDLVRIKSINGNELAIAKYFSNLLQEYGIKSKIIPLNDNDQRANLIVEIGKNNNRVLGFTGHADTVAVVNENDWYFPPFSGTIEGNRLYGRGAADMKSGLAAEIISLIELVETNQVPDGKVRMIMTVGEEFGAPGAYQIPEELIKDLDALVVGEATDGNITYAHSGSLNYRIKSSGKSVHSSTPALGLNAIQGLVTFINTEKNIFNNVAKDTVLGNVQHSITVIEGGNQINTIPAEASLLGNVRPTPSFNNKQVIALLKQQIAKINKQTDYQLKFELLHNFYSIYTSQSDNFIQSAFAISNAVYQNRDIKLIVDNGASDASVFVQTNPQMPVLLLGPDKEGSSHQINEHTTISSYLGTIEIYKNLILNYFSKTN
ncbi:succinyl-diaminopimelate desuccinylase [Fructilactobacillus lindneri]|uniref:Probable succinyl-diaminopimelate desuccinylase n=2 Tax=Fructilactobacillus lindneri TaxID=53444 RepID=A0A0R2JP64_9LACO|nr:ArgE/DapE family deacylase [Fructilactobacillus lindneri]ANZ58079.1 succinyl-diaminopimelate desuccinylase [Fructilactobacillus lindneri]ANZ59400.1 succinyl-diaminopimelate desuccinylase [Fructilactobacillus lindneri]KRN78897.1 hypothetical protein IV52_GL000300 [Fructilactobacillus lindneri DSM 20690 = JCM 11027]POG98816.1 succinyl-diaminopimelate desuccinylase [Fructilactobacillus lindneri]POH03089.1 succinyl-diaminopimelate desuccinylase [Fructilactobacillus lindneri]